MEELERAHELVSLYEGEVKGLLPAGTELFDAHVHVGRDIDGFVAPLEELLAFLAHDGVKRAFAFCLDEPDREPGFRAANDRTLVAGALDQVRESGRDVVALCPFVKAYVARHAEYQDLVRR